MNKEYTTNMAEWNIEKMGIDIVHYIVIGGIVYYASSATNYLFTSDGFHFLTPAEMRKKEQAEIRDFAEEGIDDMDEYFDEYYSLSYSGITRNLTVEEYKVVIDIEPLINIRKLLFSIKSKNILDYAR